jgi:hypothetical protein
MRRALRSHPQRDIGQRPRQGAAIGCRQGGDRRNQTLLNGHRGVPQHAPAGRRGGEAPSTSIVVGGHPGDEAMCDEPLYHHRDRALMRKRERRDFIDGRARMFRDLLQREELRAAQARPEFAVATNDPQRLDDAPERIEGCAYLGQCAT